MYDLIYLYKIIYHKEFSDASMFFCILVMHNSFVFCA